MKRICKKCFELKDISEFRTLKYSSLKLYYSYTCRMCENIRQRELRKNDPTFPAKNRQKTNSWRTNNLEKSRYILRKGSLKKFDLSVEDYETMKLQQSNLYLICSKPETRIDKRTGKVYDLSVDHDHKTGKIRGLLCRKHNLLLGLAEDNIEILNKSIDYLKNC